jgi:hypothetical protein
MRDPRILSLPKGVLAGALVLAVAFGLITRPHVQRYCVDAKNPNPFDIQERVFATGATCDNLRYTFEWGY